MGLFNMNRFHFVAALAWQFAIFLATQMLFPIFSSYVPRWRCTDPTLHAPDSFSKNCTLFEQCRHSIEYEYDYFQSASLEFDWICGPKSYLSALFAKAQFFGVLIGTVLFGSLSDFFGRKPIAVLVLTFGILMIFFSGFAPNWELLLAARFFLGLSIGGTLVVVCTLVMEMLLPQQRMALRAFFNWGMARLALTVICYVFPDWRSASLACAVCALPTLLIVLFVFPESPTWLHSKGRLEEMRNSEKRISAFAGVPYVEVPHDPIVKMESFFSMVRDRQVFRRLGVLWFMWFTAAICGYATDLNSSNIVGNLFLNQALFSILIAASKILLVTYDTARPNFSRRNLHQYAQLIVIICFLILTILVLFNEQGVSILVVNLIGTVFIEYTWDACYLCAVEAMPTEMRATSVGSCSMIARIGAVLAPTLAFLSSVWAPSAYLTVVVLGFLCLVISYLWLVETKNINLDRVKLHEDEENVQESNTVMEPTDKTSNVEEKARMLPKVEDLPKSEN